IDVDVGADFNRFSVKLRRLVTPAPDSIPGCFSQHRIAAEHLQVAHRAVLGDDGFETDQALDTRSASDCGVYRRWVSQDLPGLNATGYAKRGTSGRGVG